MRAAARVSPLVAAAVLIAVSLFFGGGVGDGRLFWIGIFAVAIGLGAVGWALLGKVFPSLCPDGARVARLRDPIGYWNALALVCAIALPLGLWLWTRRDRRVRVAGIVLLYLAVIALVLTYSRAGVV